jgi:hypothetical protein
MWVLEFAFRARQSLAASPLDALFWKETDGVSLDEILEVLIDGGDFFGRCIHLILAVTLGVPLPAESLPLALIRLESPQVADLALYKRVPIEPGMRSQDLS